MIFFILVFRMSRSRASSSHWTSMNERIKKSEKEKFVRIVGARDIRLKGSAVFRIFIFLL